MARACSASNFTPRTNLWGCGVPKCHQFSSYSSNGAAAAQLGGWAAGRPVALHVHAQPAQQRPQTTHHRAVVGASRQGAHWAQPQHGGALVGCLGPLVGGLGMHVQCREAPSRPAAQLGSSRAVAAVAAELV